MTLDQVGVGSEFVICRVSARGEIRRRLMDMGFTSGASGTLMRKAPFGDPIEVRLGPYRVAVRLAEAQGIEVAGPYGQS